MIDTPKASARLDRVVEAMRQAERFLIQSHNNPDPDSIASALALRYLVQRYTGNDAVIAYGGVVGRAENRAMVRYLDIPLIPGSLVDYDAYDFTGVCDTQVGTNYTSFPDGFVPTVVIDHHPQREGTELSDVVIIEETYGATSTIVGEMLLAKSIPIPTDVATALYYGVRTETQDLVRETSDVDVTVYRELEKLADRHLIARIESAQVPRKYFAEMALLLHSARIHKDAVVADLGSVRVPDMVAEMADFLLRLEPMRWSCVMGEYQDTIYLSLRTTDEVAHAGTVIREALGEDGVGGGHPTMAGGQVHLSKLPQDRRAGARERVLARFLERVGVEPGPGDPLVPEDSGG